MLASITMLITVAAAAAPQFETFNAPGYGIPVCGVWYAPGEAVSPMPLGGLGTGFIDFTSAATFGDNTIENNWLKPCPTALESSIAVRLGEKTFRLGSGTISPGSLRFWGHYPAADVDFADTFPGIKTHLRAFAPVIPLDSENSGLPIALFRFRVSNEAQTEIPAEIGLQWQQLVRTLGKAQGNVEGVLGWRRDALQPGEIWEVEPRLMFAQSRKALPERTVEWAAASNVKPTETAAPEGMAYSFGDVSGFLLDGFGGFDWENHGRQSAEFGGAPTIGQIFWQLDYSDKHAGRGQQGPYGLSGDKLPARTSDGALEITLALYSSGANNAVSMIFTIENVSARPVQDLRFACAVNADIGGPEKAERQEAEYEAKSAGIVFTSQEGNALLLEGRDAAGYVVAAWPEAHKLAMAGKWTPTGRMSRNPAPQPSSIPDGIQFNTPHGSVAVAARADNDDWTVQSVQTSGEIMSAVAKKTLAPGEASVVTLALAWHFPEWTSSDGESLRHYYAKYPDAGAVVAAALGKAKALEERVIAWQEKTYSSNVPGLLKDAVINSLYILPRNSWWIDDGRFFQSESFTGCPITETFVCRFNGSFPLALMWPDLEKATMLAVGGAQADSGEIPFGFGSPAGSRSPYFHVQHPIVSPEFVLTTWRNYHLTGDPGFIMYDRVQRALRYAMTLDKDGDGLVNEDPGSEKGFPANQYYDIWPWWGTSAYTGSIWLAALRAGEELARTQNDDAFADELRGWFDRARAAFDEKLWTGEYYRLYNDPAGKRKSDTLLANGLCGQWFAYATGLGDLLPKDRIDAHIAAVLRLNAKATEFGTVNGVKPDGKPDKTFPDHSAVLTIGETWNFCAMGAFAGRTDEALALFEKSYANILLNQRTPWNIPWSLDPKTGAIKWGINYYSNPCVWTLFQAVAPDAYGSVGAR